ncbi:MAG TPA: sugar phosphate nucleotidyltransferase [Candidatus Limnocylindria bacterium]|nr:sugar phosphate nucleotidyltransferase [Candidatus Limnocylindria bacterium]
MYAVILAGGGGTRLWPLSDPRHPKPFLPLFDDGSLLQKTIHRLTGGAELALTLDDIHVVTDQRYAALVSDQTDVGVIAEPVGRNTAAAIALAATSLERDPEEVMVVLPADHLVVDEDAFRGVLAAAAGLAGGAFGIESPIVTLGAQPTGPSTHYGYLVPDAGRGGSEAFPLSRFEEKPSVERANELLALPGVAWNAGIFLARGRAWLAALAKHTSLIGPLANARDSEARLARAYEQIESISIDYAVMEPAAADGQVVMSPMNVGWSDVGTWAALVDALVGGYSAPARVVQPTEEAILESDDLAVIRSDDDVLHIEPGPGRVASERPIAWLPAARRHRVALEELVARVNDAMAPAAEART